MFFVLSYRCMELNIFSVEIILNVFVRSTLRNNEPKRLERCIASGKDLCKQRKTFNSVEVPPAKANTPHSMRTGLSLPTLSHPQKSSSLSRLTPPCRCQVGRSSLNCATKVSISAQKSNNRGSTREQHEKTMIYSNAVNPRPHDQVAHHSNA